MGRMPVGSAAFVVLAFAAAQAAAPPVGQLVEGLRCESDPTQTYTLYLPAAYTTARAWPALLVFDPGGRSRVAAEVFREAAERYGFILLSSNDTRNGAPPEQNLRALQAMWPEAHRRYATDPRRVYAAGFSAGGMLAYELGRRTPGGNGLAGVIASGARWDPHHFKQPIRFPCFGAAGDTDFNYARMRDVHARLREWATHERLEIFEGAHQWMPAALAGEAVAWLELLAMKGGLRPKDQGFVEERLRAELERARALEASGAVLAAQRAFEHAAATFDGLAPVADARREAARLGALPDLKTASRDERRWDGYEERWLRQLGGAFDQLLRADPPPTAAAFRAAVEIDALRDHAQAKGYEGVVGRRLLETLATQTGLLARDLLAKKDHQRALATLSVAAEAAPTRPLLWYNLACAQARTGMRRQALDSLERAVREGFQDRSRMATDDDLASLRQEARFKALTHAEALQP
jgi:dienelactone hydrolase